jgi:hypothetical protein
MWLHDASPACSQKRGAENELPARFKVILLAPKCVTEDCGAELRTGAGSELLDERRNKLAATTKI